MLSAGHFSLRTYLRQEEREQRYRALYGASREMQRQLLTNEESMKLSSLIFQNSGESMMVINGQEIWQRSKNGEEYLASMAVNAVYDPGWGATSLATILPKFRAKLASPCTGRRD